MKETALKLLLPHVVLAEPSVHDADEFLQKVQAARSLHRNKVRPPITQRDFERFLKRARSRRFKTYLVRTPLGELAGVVNFKNLVGDPYRSASMGYYLLDEKCGGRGIMTSAVLHGLEQAFTSLRRHRIEANIQTKNTRSRALIERCGFTFEGVARGHLYIGQKWRDHERWALLDGEWAEVREKYELNGSKVSDHDQR